MIWPHGYWKIQPADGPAGDSGPEGDGRIDRTVAERLVGVSTGLSGSLKPRMWVTVPYGTTRTV